MSKPRDQDAAEPPPDAEPRPSTPPTTRSQRERVRWLRQVLDEAVADPVIQEHWGYAVNAIAEGLDVEYTMVALIHLIAERASNFASAWGPSFPGIVQALTYLWATGEWPAWTPRHAALLAPGNPIIRGPLGEYYHLEQASRPQRKQLDQYLTWLEGKHPGRPPGTPDKAPRQAPRRLDPDLARRAYELDGQRKPGQPRLFIAQALGLPYDRHDAKARDAMRQHLKRLIHYHELQLRKKFGRE
jgi:hypothetical protein